MTITHRTIETNGIGMFLAEAGPVSGPLVVLAHGFPESWYSWRLQLEALAAAGYRAVAPDMRGFGHTDKPPSSDDYTMLHHVGDIVGLLDALKAPTAVVVGHDWGGPVAWNCALLRPDRFRGVVGLSVPFFPRGVAPPTVNMPKTDHKIFYQTYFQTPGVAEAEFERDPRETVRKFQLLWSGDGDPALREQATMVDRNGGFFSGKIVADALPAWVSDADIDFYAGEFERGGFRGPLNWYRAIDRNWELMAPWAGARVMIPAMYLVGADDMLLTFRGMDKLVPNLELFVPSLREKLIVPDCGHWIQRQRPDIVNAALLRFLGGLS